MEAFDRRNSRVCTEEFLNERPQGFIYFAE